MLTIKLPKTVYEDTLEEFIQRLSIPNDTKNLCIDFSACQFVIPSATALLLARIHGLLKNKVNVSFHGHQECSIFGYLQRMNFFQLCGLNFPETFTRHISDGRFVPLQLITKGRIDTIGSLSTKIADCVFPELSNCTEIEKTGPYDTIEYSVSELANNVVQHSLSNGFAIAQKYPQKGIVRLAISDYGIGIRESFESNLPPDWKSEWNDLQTIQYSLKPQISSKMHLSGGWGEPVNAGVGLSLLQELAKVTNGDFVIFSGQGFHRIRHEGTIVEEDCSLKGTLCAVTIPIQSTKMFHVSLNSAKVNLGLIDQDDDFSGSFI